MAGLSFCACIILCRIETANLPINFNCPFEMEGQGGYSLFYREACQRFTFIVRCYIIE